MKHITSVSRVPTCAADIPTSVKMEFIISLLMAVTPLLDAKDPSVTPVTPAS